MDCSEREQRFVKVYETYLGEVYRYVYIRTGLLTAVAEDITQEIFLDVFRGFDRFKGLCSEKTWVMRIARNKVYDFYRKKSRKCFEFLELDGDTAFEIPDRRQDIEALLDGEADKMMVLACLRSLPEHYKMVLLLKYVDGKSVKEIAAITDKTCKSIDNILQRAKHAFIKQYTLLGAEDKI
jgi:RNA polymerase sigma-70 factor (ECF subfamily)